MRVQHKQRSKEKPTLRIGVFDSGVGGITVLQALQDEALRAIPASSLNSMLNSIEFVYLGDTAHVPYGGRSPKQIRELSQACAKRLKKEKIHALVVACNTASSWALPQIQKEMGKVLVLGVIESGVKAALDAVKKMSGSFSSTAVFPVLVLATRATVKSKSYLHSFESELKKQSASVARTRVASFAEKQTSFVSVIEQQACPLLVPMIEEGWAENSNLRPLLKATIEAYVRPFRERYPDGGVAVLACTHYPWIKDLFESELPNWRVIDSAQSVAEQLFGFLDMNCPSPSGKKVSSTRSKRVSPRKFPIKWIFTDPDVVPEFARQVSSLG